MDWTGVLAVTLLVLFVAYNLLPLVKAVTARGRAVPLLEPLLTEAQRAKPRLLIYFWSPNCGPCRVMTPLIDRLAAESGAVLKFNVVESMALARQFGVMATPSLAVVESGVLQKLVVGPRSEMQLHALLENR